MQWMLTEDVMQSGARVWEPSVAAWRVPGVGVRPSADRAPALLGRALAANARLRRGGPGQRPPDALRQGRRLMIFLRCWWCACCAMCGSDMGCDGPASRGATR
eukprot:3265862-Rhodomonas_salina.3